MSEQTEPLAVTNFREYLKVKSVQPNPEYSGCVNLLKSLYGNIGLDVSVREVKEGKPILVFSKPGTDPTLPSVLLNSHMDVVPVTESKWKHDPFGGDKDSEGRIYGRGSQDCKCLGIQALEAMRRLGDKQFLRTVHVSFVPDEEIGGKDGMGAWVKTDDFKKLNVGVEFDEGCVVDFPVYPLFNAERSIWSVEVKCRGTSGHGSLFVTNTAVEKLQSVLDQVMEFRRTEENKFKANPMANWALNATTVNLTMIHGGSHHNIVPDEITVNFDCRLAPSMDFDYFENWFREVCKKAGEGVSVEFLTRDPKWPISPVDGSNPFWNAFSRAMEKMEVPIMAVTTPGTTDARYLRQVGIPAYGLSPMIGTPILLHDHNEFVYEDKFLKGIDIFEAMIVALASVPAS